MEQAKKIVLSAKACLITLQVLSEKQTPEDRYTNASWVVFTLFGVKVRI
jgi:hypothetical protein